MAYQQYQPASLYTNVGTELTPKSVVEEEPAGRLELIITVLLLMFFADGFDVIKPLEKLLAASSYIIIPALIVRQWRRFLYFGTRDITLLLLVGLALLSFFWSESPASTLSNGRALVRVTAFGVYLAMRYSIRDQIKLLAWSFGLLTVISFISGIVQPFRGIRSDAWRGAFPHKNYLARMMVISATTFLVSWLSELKQRRLLLAGFLFSGILILLSNGKTALVQIIFLMFFVLPVCNVIRSHYKIRVFVLSLIVSPALLLSYLFINNFETIAVTIFDKENSLGGRSNLKKVLWDTFFWEKPWVGHGYFGFWRSQYDRVVSAVSEVDNYRGVPWVPSHAHSGFIDLGLSLGLLGLLLFTLNFVIAYLAAISFLSSSKDPISFWPFIYLTIFCLSNVNVTMTILSSKNLMWALYVATTISLQLWPKKQII